MKRLLLVFIGLLFTFSIYAQIKQTRREIRRETKQQLAERVDSIIKSQNFIFLVNSANPVRWPSIQLTSEYQLVVYSDSVNVYLPYYGRAYRVDFMSEGGIKLNEIMNNYSIELKKNNYEIQFDAKSTFDHYQFNLTVTSTGYGTLTVNSNNRQVISYGGILGNIEL